MLLLSQKSFEKCRKNGIETRENRISLTRWKKKKIEFCCCRNRYLFDCNQFQPFSQSNREGVSSSLTNAKNHTFLFFLSFSNFTNCCEQADFKSLSTFLVFNNPQIRKKKENNKFKTYFANAVEISIISTNLIKITLSQNTIQKEWRLISFCEIW